MRQDIAMKALEEYNEVYAEIFNELVFGGVEVLKESELRPLPTSAVTEQIDGTIHEYFRDIRKADQRGQEYILITAIENQSGIDCAMPVRVMGYEFSSYMEQIRQLTGRNQKENGTGRLRTGQKLTPAVTAVLYWGKGKWQQPSRLYDILDFSYETQRQVQPLVNDYRIHVISMRRLPANVRERLHGDLRGVVECISADQNERERYMKLQQDDLTIRHPAEFFALIGSLVDDRRYGRLKDRWMAGKLEGIKSIGDKEGIQMATILDVAEEIGMKRGMEQGISQGISQGIMTCMRALMEKRFCSAEEAANLFGLSEEDRQKYLNMLQQ